MTPAPTHSIGAERSDRDHEAAAPWSEERYFELRALLDTLDEQDLAKFRADPANRAILQQFDAFVFAQVRVFVWALILLLVLSVGAAVWQGL